jgi:hypothetical protein
MMWEPRKPVPPVTWDGMHRVSTLEEGKGEDSLSKRRTRTIGLVIIAWSAGIARSKTKWY